jgi:hypothetical protein
MVGEAKGMMKGAEHDVVARGIAAELNCPQHGPTIMHQDNMGVVTRLKHLSPTTEATKAHSRMFNYLRSLVEMGIILPKYIQSKLQPADPMTKAQTALDNIRSLEMLQGHQPYIATLREEYEEYRKKKRHFDNTGRDPVTDTIAENKKELIQTIHEVVNMAISSLHLEFDEYPRFPFHLFDDYDDNSENIQEAFINAIKNSPNPISNSRLHSYLIYINSQVHDPQNDYPTQSSVRWSNTDTFYTYHPNSSLQ